MKVYARMNHGRWLADCPDPQCNSAELVFHGHKFVCGNPEHGRKTNSAFYIQQAILKAERKGVTTIYSDSPDIGIPIETAEAKMLEYADTNCHEVIWPEAEKAIEALAILRPKESRNWPVSGNHDDGFDYSEPISVMQAENKQHGIGE